MAEYISRISTHVLDLARGKPAEGMPVRLERQNGLGSWQLLGSGLTDDDGRCQLLGEGTDATAGVYRLAFDTASYHAAKGLEGLYPTVQITFTAGRGETHFHIPLLLSPFGYTTYRGS